MSDRPRSPRETDVERARLDAAVRRATPMSRLVTPSRRNLIRSMAVYANVFALLVALGIPNGTLRRAAGDALVSFDGAARQASEGFRVMVAAPSPSGESTVWSETVTDVSSPVEALGTSFMPEAPVAGVPELPALPSADTRPDLPVAPPLPAAESNPPAAR